VIVYLDANIVIYLIENRPFWGPKATASIAGLRSRGDELAISDLTRMECRVGLLKSSNSNLLADYDAFFLSTDLHILAMTAQVFDKATMIRATRGFAALDSLHLAAAVIHGCDRFLTSDAQLARFPDIAVKSSREAGWRSATRPSRRRPAAGPGPAGHARDRAA
jgi:predicted nucleic acid-binding protein